MHQPTTGSPVLTGNVLQGSLDMSLDMAARDSPYLRANLNHFEDDVEELARWMDGVVKAMKNYFEELGRFNDITLAMVSKLRTHRKISLIDATVVNTFADAFQTVCTFKAKLAEDMHEHLIAPVQKYLREDLKDIREMRKSHEKATERYDAAVTKFAALPKNKEPSALQEDAFVLFDARKLYIRSCVDYAHQIVLFKDSLETIMTDRLMAAMYSHVDYMTLSSEVFMGLKPSMDALRVRLLEKRKLLPTRAEIMQRRREIEEQAISRARPMVNVETSWSFPLEVTAPRDGAAAANAGPSTLGRTPSAQAVSHPLTPSQVIQTGANVGPNGIRPQLLIQQGGNAGTFSQSFAGLPGSAAGSTFATEKEGYLFKRNPPKPLQPPTWTRRYFMIKGGGLSYCVSRSQGKHRGVVMSTNAVNILLCSVRIEKKEDRRFCFELFTSKKSFMLQAESEREMFEWIGVFETAKAQIMADYNRKKGGPPGNTIPMPPTLAISNSSSVPSSVPTTPTIEKQEFELGGSNVISPSGISNGSTAPPLNPDDDINDVDEDEVEEKDNRYSQDRNDEDDDDDDGAEEGVVRKVEIEEDGADDHNGSLIRRNSEMDGIVIYPSDTMYEKRNRELHTLLKSVPRTDFLIDVFSCGLQKDIVIQGKLYITQNRLCFHSNILGFITFVVIYLDHVTNITRVKSAFTSAITVVTPDAHHQFKTFMKDDAKTLSTMKFIWQNARKTGPERLSAQAVFDHVYASQAKSEEKETVKEKGAGKTDTEKEPVAATGSDDAATAKPADGGPTASTEQVEEQPVVS
ncbi:SNF1-interacting protein, partial [Blyttiomyces sp. JEL0837]